MPRLKQLIEEYDFILLYRGNLLEAIEKKLQPLQQQLLDASIKVLPFYLKDEHETYLLVSMRSEQAIRQHAQLLQLLKPKDKRSFRLTEVELSKQLANPEISKDYQDYLKFIRVRLHNPSLRRQEHMSCYNSLKHRQFQDMVPEGHQLFTVDEVLRCRYNELLKFSVEYTTRVG